MSRRVDEFIYDSSPPDQLTCKDVSKDAGEETDWPGVPKPPPDHTRSGSAFTHLSSQWSSGFQENGVIFAPKAQKKQSSRYCRWIMRYHYYSSGSQRRQAELSPLLPGQLNRFSSLNLFTAFPRSAPSPLPAPCCMRVWYYGLSGLPLFTLHAGVASTTSPFSFFKLENFNSSLK